jgi:hypothetical protein
VDHDLRIRTPAHWPDTFRCSTDQKVGGSSPSERTSERASPEATSEPGRALSLTRLLTAASDGGRYRVSEDVGGLGELVADGMGICAQNLLAQGLPPIRLITSS